MPFLIDSNWKYLIHVQYIVVAGLLLIIHWWRKSTLHNSTGNTVRWNFNLLICNASPIPFSWANYAFLKSALLDVTPSRIACLDIRNSSIRTNWTKGNSSYAKPSSLVGRRVFVGTRWYIPTSLSVDRFQRFPTFLSKYPRYCPSFIWTAQT